MGLLDFRKTKTRDHYLGEINQALLKGDDAAVVSLVRSLVAGFKKDPHIVIPAQCILGHFRSPGKDYLAATIAGQILDQAETGTTLAELAMKEYFQAACRVQQRDPLTAIMAYAKILKSDTAETSSYRNQCFDQLDSICRAPDPLDAAAILQGLMELTDAVNEDSDEEKRLQSNTLHLADIIQPRYPLGALDAYTYVLEGMEESHPEKTRVMKALLDTALIISDTDDGSALQAVTLLAEEAKDNPEIYTAAQRLKKQIERRTKGADYSAGAPALTPEKFIVLRGASIKPE